jgi:hypothetical protein
MFLSKIKSSITKENTFLFFLSLMLLFKAPFDPDIWWHIKYGQIIFETHKFPIFDTYSYAYSGYRWATSYWIPQVAQYLLFKTGGFVLLSLVFSSALSVTLVWLVNKRSQVFGLKFYQKALALMIMCVGFSSFGVTSRPMLFSCILMTALWYLLNNSSRTFGRYAFIPFIFLIRLFFRSDFLCSLIR